MGNPIGTSPRPASFRLWLATSVPALVIAAAFAIVVGGTGFVSYTHISALTLELHQSWKTAHLTPLFIDGQIVIGSVFYMVVPGRTRWWGLVGIVPGLGESLFANWESGIAYGREDAFWAVVAAQTFAGSSFLFERWLKVRSEKGGSPEARIVTVTAGCGHGVAEDRDGRILDAYLHLRDCLGADPSYRGIGLAFGVHNEIVRQVVMAVANDGGEKAEPGADLPEPQPVPYLQQQAAAYNGNGSHA